MRKRLFSAKNSKVLLGAALGVVILGGTWLFADNLSNSAEKGETGFGILDESREFYDAYADVREEEIVHFISTVDFSLGRGSLFENTPIVALVYIDSIDGGRSWSPIHEVYALPYTHGKMTVVDVYKGNIEVGQQLNYSRAGGVIPYDEYINSMTKDEREKFTRGVHDNQPKYIQVHYDGDIGFKAGKTYVAFLDPQSSKDGKTTDYVFSWLQYGTREAKATHPVSRSANSEITVLNNLTGEWEPLDRVIPLDMQRTNMLK